jgi:hypothetical protein
MSLILVDGLKDRPGTGGPKFPNGLHLPAGIGITGDGHINMAGVCTFSGNVTIGGTLTYEDVTNIDSVGVVTARSGVNVSGGEFKVGTAITVGSAGVSTFFGAVNLNKKTTVNATLEATEGLNVTAGVGTFAGNVSIADKIVHTGDTNTAIRFSGADTVKIETAGSNRFQVNDNGKIGVGVDPTAYPGKFIVSGAAGGASGILCDREIISRVASGVANTERGFQQITDGVEKLAVYVDNGSAVRINNDNGSERVCILGTGRVGIGTSAADAKVEISDATTGGTGGTGEEVLLKLSGRATKNAYLDINADADRRGVIRFKSAGTDKWSIGRGDSDEVSDSSFMIATGSSGGNTAKLIIDSSGRLLLGTTTEGNESADELTVSNSGNTGITIRSTDSSNCSLFFSDATSGASEYTGYVQYVHSNNSLKFGTATTERLVIDSDGAMELTPSENTGNDGFTVTPGGGDTASYFKVLGNQSTGGADGRNGGVINIDANYYVSTSTIFSLAARGTNVYEILGNGNHKIGGTGGTAAVSQSRNLNIGSNSEANLAIETHNDSTSETANIRFYKSGNTGASPQIVEADDNLAQIMVYGHDGTDYANQAAGIKFNVDGTPGSNDMPGEIQLLTNNGTGGVGNRFNISATGNIGWMGDATSSSAIQQRKRFSSISHSANTTYDVNICEDFGNDDVIKLEYAFCWNDGDGGAWGTAIAWKHHDGNTEVRYLGEEVASPVSSFVLAFDGNTVKARIAYGGSGMNGRRMLNVECGGQCSPAEF